MSPQMMQSMNASNVEAPEFNMGNPLSCKWASRVGPRVGCVRGCPMELQSQAMEQVNLSPRATHGHFGNSGPIPSPMPSHMGLPSPRVAIVGNADN